MSERERRSQGGFLARQTARRPLLPFREVYESGDFRAVRDEIWEIRGLAASVRQQVVGLLSAQGMSTRAIAPVAGVSFQQVAKIAARQVSPDATPEPAIDFTTGEVLTDQRGGIGSLSAPRRLHVCEESRQECKEACPL